MEKLVAVAPDPTTTHTDDNDQQQHATTPHQKYLVLKNPLKSKNPRSTTH